MCVSLQKCFTVIQTCLLMLQKFKRILNRWLVIEQTMKVDLT